MTCWNVTSHAAAVPNRGVPPLIHYELPALRYEDCRNAFGVYTRGGPTKSPITQAGLIRDFIPPISPGARWPSASAVERATVGTASRSGPILWGGSCWYRSEYRQARHKPKVRFSRGSRCHGSRQDAVCGGTSRTLPIEWMAVPPAGGAQRPSSMYYRAHFSPRSKRRPRPVPPAPRPPR